MNRPYTFVIILELYKNIILDHIRHHYFRPYYKSLF